MRALVTGAAGFVGSHLAEALLARGDEVVGVDCFTPYYDEATKRANVAALRRVAARAPLEADLRTADARRHRRRRRRRLPPGRAGRRAAFVVGRLRRLPRPQRARDATAARGRRAERAGRAVRVRVELVGVRQPGALPDDRGRPPRPVQPLRGDETRGGAPLRLVRRELGDCRTISLRYFTVFGPRQRPDMSIHRLCEAAISGEPFPRFGDGEQVREFTFVADIVAANLAAAGRRSGCRTARS